ncbi:hypothetical protein B0H12DRAFT_1229772 [Mycena haematopus]|nr:hypothetical protein B0H12DRAFT_1229772 [Mycena haematopus]
MRIRIGLSPAPAPSPSPSPANAPRSHPHPAPSPLLTLTRRTLAWFMTLTRPDSSSLTRPDSSSRPRPHALAAIPQWRLPCLAFPSFFYAVWSQNGPGRLKSEVRSHPAPTLQDGATNARGFRRIRIDTSSHAHTHYPRSLVG